MRIKFITALVPLILLFYSGCNSIDTTKSYVVNKTTVIQKPYTAFSQQPGIIISDYKDGFTKSTNAVVQFKFSINGADNENKPGNDHYILIRAGNNNFITPVYKFGETKKEEKETAGIKDEYLPANSEINVTFRVDFSSVIKALNEKGFYITYSGAKITKEDFQGLFIAGATEPLSWNFGEIQKNPAYKMTDPDGDGIFECKVTFKTNDYRSIDEKGRAVWKLKKVLSEFPRYETQDVLQQSLYNMSLEELLLDIRPDSTFMAGAKWNGVWTRDISYSIYLSLAMIKPDIAKKSLMKKVNNKMIIQDTGTGGSWPVSTDRVVWSIAAWEVYLATGDTDWLKYAYEVIKNVVDADMPRAYNHNLNLVYGESSFLDWREQTYPLWMDPKDIYKSICLGTNALHFRTYEILNLMEKELGITENKYSDLPGKVKEAINSNLWLNNKKYYGQYLYGRSSYELSPKSESLGEALAVLFDIADSSRSKDIIANMPVVEFGAPCIYPQIPNIPPYHNNAVWPFVLTYWTWASAKAGNDAAVEFGMDALKRASALFLTNKENMVAENGHFDGTEINSDRMLWSISGNLASVYRILFGISLSPSGLSINPFVTRNNEGIHELKDFKYRNASLDITVNGCGAGIKEAYIDGKKVENILISPETTGKHKVEIVLNNSFAGGSVNIVKNHFAPAAPVLSVDDNQLKWNSISGADKYKIIKNGNIITETTDTVYKAEPGKYTDEYSVIAVDKSGYESFMTEPVNISLGVAPEIKPAGYEIEKEFTGYTSPGYVRTNTQKNTELNFTANITESGYYYLDFRYANGNGPINTFNACGIRSLYINDKYTASIVLPQRGENVWTNWGYSNSVKCYFEKGETKICLKYQSSDKNMNGEINEALIDAVRILPVK